MKLLISGSRTITKNKVLETAMTKFGLKHAKLIIHGGADGVDTLADQYADQHNIQKDVHEISAQEWKELGKSAGPIRNRKMLDLLDPDEDCVLVIWDGQSKGSQDVIDEAMKRKLKCFVMMAKPTGIVK